MALQLTTQQLQGLLSPLHGARVKSRSQGGRSMSYLEAWDVRATLIRVFGFGGFDVIVSDARIIHQEQKVARDKEGNIRKTKWQDELMHWHITAQATTTLVVRDGHGGEAVYSETVTAMQTGPDHGEVSDFAMKTAASDGLKRAAVNLGTQFGLSLYDKGSLADVVRNTVEQQQVAQLQGAPDTSAPTNPSANPSDDTANSVKVRISHLLPDKEGEAIIETVAEVMESTPDKVPAMTVPELQEAENRIRRKLEADEEQAREAITEGLGGEPVEPS